MSKYHARHLKRLAAICKALSNPRRLRTGAGPAMIVADFYFAAQA